jgi:hypothetical protein
VVGCGEESVEQSFAAEGELLKPGEKLAHRATVREDMDNIAGRPPLLGDLAGRGNVERLREALGIGDNVNEFSKHLGGDGDLVGGTQ